MILFFIALAIIISILPLFLIFYGVAAPIILYDKKYGFYYHRKGKRILIFIGLLLLGIIMLPITLILEIIPGSCLLGKKSLSGPYS
mmetsp:Transcript_19765/g.2680  ORF Transcript_19765/g.2680 Transcript_19765/m.2680 type:complete len:86 (-) Transcript_19765:102-359(-)